MADRPIVDILIPTIGRPSLATAMLSALAQTYPRVRVIVASDRDHIRAQELFDQTDVLRRVVGRAESRFVKTPQRFGRGDRVKEWWIAHSDSSPIIHFLDDDDWLPPTAIYDLVIRMIWDSDVVLVVSRALQIRGQAGRSVKYCVRDVDIARGSVVANTALFKKEAAKGVRLESDPANPRFWLHDIAEHGKVVQVRLPLYWYNATRASKPNPALGLTNNDA